MKLFFSDSFLSLKLHSLAGKVFWLDWLVIFFGQYFEYVLIALLLGFIFWSKQVRLQYWRMVILALISAIFSRLVITEIIRALYFRARPFQIFEFIPLIFHETSSSLPSGHASFFFAISTIVLLYNKKWGIGFFVGSALIGLARVIAGIHFLGDILLGLSVGILGALVVYWIYNLWCRMNSGGLTK